MLIFFFVLLGVFVAFSLYSRRFNNPYRLIFIFGKKGSGKSTLMVKMMIKDLKKGWTVYTDMADVNLPGVRIISSSKLLSSCAPCDSNSAIYLDEAGIAFDNRNFKNFDAGLRDFFKLQRKYRCKVVLNSQSFDVDKKIRDLTDCMILQSSIGNVISLSRPIKRSVALVEATAQGDSRIADNLVFSSIFSWRFTWMPSYHRFFNSFDAPVRPSLPFSEVKGVLADVLRNKPIKSIEELEDDENVSV